MSREPPTAGGVEIGAGPGAVPGSVPSCSRTTGTTGNALSHNPEGAYTLPFPVFPVFGGRESLLEIAERIVASALPARAFFESPARAKPENREHREQKDVTHQTTATYPVPSRRKEPGTSGNETGNTLSGDPLLRQWSLAVEEVAAAWESHAARAQDEGRGPRWIDDDPSAAWFDWRLRVGPDYVGILDEAFRAVIGGSRLPQDTSGAGAQRTREESQCSS
jgi:hypothetical protein